jgi:hypothetical protein
MIQAFLFLLESRILHIVIGSFRAKTGHGFPHAEGMIELVVVAP